MHHRAPAFFRSSAKKTSSSRLILFVLICALALLSTGCANPVFESVKRGLAGSGLFPRTGDKVGCPAGVTEALPDGIEGDIYCLLRAVVHTGVAAAAAGIKAQAEV